MTLQSQTVNGKTTSGIFFLPSSLSKTQNVPPKNSRTKAKFSSKSSENKSHNIRVKPTDDDKKGKKNFKTLSNNKTGIERQDIVSKLTKSDVVFINNHSKVEDSKQLSKKTTNLSVESGEKKTSNRFSRNNGKTSNIRVRPVNQTSKAPTKELKVDTNFVTLTQDQLNTILNLVKTKQEIDLATVINKEEKVPDSEKKVSLSDAKHVVPTSVPGLDLDDPSSNTKNENESDITTKSKNESDKENDSNENVKKLLQKVTDEPATAKDKQIDVELNSNKDKGDAGKKLAMFFILTILN